MKKFTSTELLCVILLFGVFGSILYPTLCGCTKEAPMTKAEVDCKLIAIAVMGYKNDFKELPGKGEMVFAGDIQKVLAGVNPKRKVYFESKGDFLNPWGEPYIVKFDDDHDGEVKVASGPVEIIQGSVAVWTEIKGNTFVHSWE